VVGSDEVGECGDVHEADLEAERNRRDDWWNPVHMSESCEYNAVQACMVGGQDTAGLVSNENSSVDILRGISIRPTLPIVNHISEAGLHLQFSTIYR
jgi:hypothetical protein